MRKHEKQSLAQGDIDIADHRLDPSHVPSVGFQIVQDRPILSNGQGQKAHPVHCDHQIHKRQLSLMVRRIWDILRNPVPKFVDNQPRKHNNMLHGRPAQVLQQSTIVLDFHQ